MSDLHAPGAASPPPGQVLSLVALVSAVLLLGFVLWSRGDLDLLQDAEPQAVVARGDLAADEQATIEIFERSSRSVVYVTTTWVEPRLFVGAEEERPAGTGTGFVWDADGHIVTNYHVIQNANRAYVTFADQTTYEASLVGVAPTRDLAVLRVDAPRAQLHPVAVGSSHDLRVGQKVLAIGNPFGLDQTLTTGVVSALNRSIRSPSRHRIDGVIQTDAAINRGNSGGPLLDSAGRLIGVNTMITSPTGYSVGIGFAVPVDIVQEAVPQLIEHGRITRPGLGIVLDERTYSDVQGVHIVSVSEGSAAERAGLRGPGRRHMGDFIMAVDDQPVRTRDDLLDALADHEIGDTVLLGVNRIDEQTLHQLEVPVVLQAIQ